VRGGPGRTSPSRDDGKGVDQAGLIALLARVLAADGWRTPTVRLISVSLLGFLFGDSAWGADQQQQLEQDGVRRHLLAIPFLMAYTLIGAAARHASASELGTPAVEDRERSNRALIASILLASLIAPAILAVQALSGHTSRTDCRAPGAIAGPCRSR
jgi:hypothetical protein